MHLAGDKPGAHPRRNGFKREDGVLWIAARNFDLRPEDEADLKLMLDELRRTSGIKHVVFDLRGNRGGDSSVGWRLFEAVTGGLGFDEAGIEALPRTYAQWRVSDASISAARTRIDRSIDLHGADSERTRQAREFLDSLVAARDRGQPWLEQSAGHRITREEVARRHGRLKRFSGTVVMVTDHGCASACLDMVDLVKLVPGSIHLGQATSADSVYIDVGWMPLPSGNTLMLPLKVWRNRVRGNNEPVVPELAVAGDIEDDEAVNAAVAAALRSSGSLKADSP
jgi:hypothetical protein